MAAEALVGQAWCAPSLDAGFGQSAGEPQILAARTQQVAAQLDHAIPVGEFDLGLPFALIEDGIILAPRLRDLVEFGGKREVE